MDRFRWLSNRLPTAATRRVLVVTGARQTGKTTLVRRTYSTLRYFNLDVLETREQLRQLATTSWSRTVGASVIDEAQKEPSVFDKVKYAYDEGQIDFSVLLGSSRFLLLDRVRESLAGRAFVFELWPLMASEIRTAATASPEVPILDRVLDAREPLGSLLRELPPVLLGDDDRERREAMTQLATYGGMPELLRLDDSSRREWLRSYQQTFLERDLFELARLSDLEPFRKLQRLCMLRTGQILQYSNLARDAGIGATTARRYLEYLRLSYQIVLLQPYATNLTSQVIKTPKLYWMDLGLLRHETMQLGPLDGPLFETLVISEIKKWIDTSGRPADLSFYRSTGGLEVDALIRTPYGLLGFEVKLRDTVVDSDARALRAIAAVAKPPLERWLGGVVVYDGSEIRCIDEERAIWAIPAHRLF
jgi:uncharacterized protein